MTALKTVFVVVLGLVFLLPVSASNAQSTRIDETERSRGGPGLERIPQPPVMGGEDARISNYPWIVSIGWSSKPSYVEGHFCGGSVIRSHWVLTAAHCMDRVDAPDQIYVLTGTDDLRDGGRRIRVVGIRMHGGWNPETKDNDIALIKLSEPVGSTAVSVLEPGQEESLTPPGAMMTITGWGHKEEGGEVSPKLQEAEVPIVDREVCKETYGNRITPNMICAGYENGGVDTCHTDSGGPLRIKGGVVLAGVVSWGVGCGRPGNYGVYTRVAEYSDWIRAHTQ